MGITSSRNISKGIKEFSDHRFACALDLGQSQDPSCCAILEGIKTSIVRYSGEETPKDEKFVLRHLQRFPLGMSYVRQVAEVKKLLARPPLLQGCEFVIDETGVGRPVGDLFDDAGLKPTRVTITTGDNQTQKADRRFHVSKSLLVGNLSARLATGELLISSHLSEAEVLRSELQQFRRHVSATGRSSYAAEEGSHDDTVVSLCLALWVLLRKKHPPARIGRYGMSGAAINFNR